MSDISIVSVSTQTSSDDDWEDDIIIQKVPKSSKPFLHEYLSTSLRNTRILSLSVGGFFSSILTSNGVLTTGRNSYHHLGLGIRLRKAIFEFTLIKSLKKHHIIKHACGYNHQLFLMDNGSVYSTGWNCENQCGIVKKDKESEFIKIPKKIMGLPKIHKIYAGCRSSFFLTKNGKVYTCGDIYDGLYHDKITDKSASVKNVYLIPPSFFSNDKVVEVLINEGSEHCFFKTITRKKKVKYYICGNDSYGKLGLAMSDGKVMTPFLFKWNEGNIRQISVGGDFTLILLKNGKVFSCGVNKSDFLGYGELGLGKSITHQNVPREITALKNEKIVKIKAQVYNSFFWNSKGDVFAAGYNEKGQVHSTREKRIFLPIKMQINNIKDIASGDSHSIVTTHTGELIVAGCNKHGQLGLKRDEKVADFYVVYKSKHNLLKKLLNEKRNSQNFINITIICM